jgi:hypothetical protein
MKDRNQEDLINKLVEELPPKTKIFNLTKAVTIWIFVTLVFSGLAFYLLNLGPKVSHVMSSPFMVVESFFTLLLGILAATGAFILAVPSGRIDRKFKVMALVPTVLWMITLFLRWYFEFDFDVSKLAIGSSACAYKITGLALIPSAVLFFFARQASPLKPYTTGLLALVSGYGISAFFMGAACSTMSPFHHLIYHFLPVIGVAALGLLLGKKILS